jgi:hypothetical protein
MPAVEFTCYYRDQPVVILCGANNLNPRSPMRPLLVLVSAVLALTPMVRGAPAADPVLTKGLQVCVTNGIDACVLTWYADRPALSTQTKEKLAAFTKELGNVIDTEVVTIQPITKRYSRIYVAIYFVRRPLWIRLDRYTSADQSFYLPPRYSLDPDEILPGYITEFPP